MGASADACNVMIARCDLTHCGRLAPLDPYRRQSGDHVANADRLAGGLVDLDRPKQELVHHLSRPEPPAGTFVLTCHQDSAERQIGTSRVTAHSMT